jgi:TPR repeat protein
MNVVMLPLQTRRTISSHEAISAGVGVDLQQAYVWYGRAAASPTPMPLS